MSDLKIPLIGALIERLRKRSDHEIIKAAMQSKGDVAKVEGYANMTACIDRLSMLDAGGGSLGKPLRVAKRTLAALQKNRPAFQKSFSQDGSEAVRLVYANAVAGLWHTVSLLCAEGVTFVKGADGSYGAVVNRGAVDGMAGSITVTRLERFCDAAEKYGFEQVVTETAMMVEKETLVESIGFMAGAAIAVTGLAALLMLARDLAEKFYSLRGSLSRWLDLQAKFLEMNALTVNRSASRSQQEAYAKQIRALADRIRVEDADTEREASSAIQQDDRALQSVQDQPRASSGGGQLL